VNGLTTSPIPYGEKTFKIDFNFLKHRLKVVTSDGKTAGVLLKPQSVAEFYQHLMDGLVNLRLNVNINTVPNEMADVIPFQQDETHRAYDPEYANRFWRILVQVDRV